MRRAILSGVLLACLFAYLAAVPAVAQDHTRKISTTNLVKDIRIGSKGLTVTLGTGQRMNLDLSAMTGPGGRLTYVGWGMLMFGVSLAMRLLSTIGRVFQPVLGRRERRDER